MLRVSLAALYQWLHIEARTPDLSMSLQTDFGDLFQHRLCWCRRGFERLIRKLLELRGSPAVLVLHWWAPLHFRSSFWNVAEDELDTIGSYYDLQVPLCDT